MLKIVLSKWYIVLKDANVIFIVMRPPKTRLWNLKYNLEQFGKISNYHFLSDDTRNAIDMLLLTDKLKIKCCLFYELLTNTKMCVNVINILIFIISIVIVTIVIVTIIVIIIVIIIITITVFTISIIIIFVKCVKSDNYLLQIFCHMTSNVKFSQLFFFLPFLCWKTTTFYELK